MWIIVLYRRPIEDFKAAIDLIKEIGGKARGFGYGIGIVYWIPQYSLSHDEMETLGITEWN